MTNAQLVASLLDEHEGQTAFDLTLQTHLSRQQTSSALSYLKSLDQAECSRWHETYVWFRL